MSIQGRDSLQIQAPYRQLLAGRFKVKFLVKAPGGKIVRLGIERDALHALPPVGIERGDHQRAANTNALHPGADREAHEMDSMAMVAVGAVLEADNFAIEQGHVEAAGILPAPAQAVFTVAPERVKSLGLNSSQAREIAGLDRPDLHGPIWFSRFGGIHPFFDERLDVVDQPETGGFHPARWQPFSGQPAKLGYALTAQVGDDPFQHRFE